MNVKIQSVKFDADQKLVDFIEAKMAKLERFAEGIILSETVLKIDKDAELGNKVATIKLELPGQLLVSEHRGKTFEEAIDLGIDALKKQIEKFKERQKA